MWAYAMGETRRGRESWVVAERGRAAGAKKRCARMYGEYTCVSSSQRVVCELRVKKASASASSLGSPWHPGRRVRHHLSRIRHQASLLHTEEALDSVLLHILAELSSRARK